MDQTHGNAGGAGGVSPAGTGGTTSAGAGGGAAGTGQAGGGASGAPATAGAAGSSQGGSGGGQACSDGTFAFCDDDCGKCADKSACEITFLPSGASGLGVCGSPAYFDHAVECYGCGYDDPCALENANPPLLKCVPKGLCDEKLARGELGCFFSDKTTYSNQGISPPADCPAPAPGAPAFCGGSCGDCPTGLTCSGRSPAHPVGLCVAFAPSVGTPSKDWCGFGSSQVPCAKGSTCFVYSDPDHQALAKRYGMCLPTDTCTALVGALPGGGACLDASGTVVSGGL